MPKTWSRSTWQLLPCLIQAVIGFTPEGADILKRIGSALKTATNWKATLTGHADNQKIKPPLKRRFASNKELSEARAENGAKILKEVGSESLADPRTALAMQLPSRAIYGQTSRRLQGSISISGVKGSREMVPKAGLEPARVTPHAPQTCVSTSSTTSALFSSSEGWVAFRVRCAAEGRIVAKFMEML